jgi:DNA primase
MPGRIVDEDLQTVRERSRIADVVGSYVTLRPIGGGSLVGLCPFHDEKTPSFRVTPARGFYYCFGCGEGGDVISFVEKINHVSFIEAVEFLADRAKVVLRYADGGPRVEPGLRMRVLEANLVASEFYGSQLRSPDAIAGRRFLDQRGFDREACAKFGVGFAPRGGRALLDKLEAAGFSKGELVKANLVRENGWDVFQGRLIWPIRDAGRAVLGFGARKIFDDDRMPGKYVNTSETVVYKKSSVLYGLDLARGSIASKNQAVVVEGYTDVMACHLVGVDNAVASCGTAFGEGHARMLQRLIGAVDIRPGEIIFTFDGDAAGQAAALKVFELDEAFSAQTYVAVEPSGLDPCDLRLQRGDAALRELVGRRIPLYRFVMQNRLANFDLERFDSQLAAIRAVTPLVTHIRDNSLVEGYIRELANMVGLDPNLVRKEVRSASSHRRPDRGAPAQLRAADGRAESDPLGSTLSRPVSSLPMPDPNNRHLAAERATVRLLLTSPRLFTGVWNGLKPEDFAHPAYRALVILIFGVADVERADSQWIHAVLRNNTDPVLERLVSDLSSEPDLREPDAEYVDAYATQVRLLRLSAQIEALKPKLQRTNPIENADYPELYRALIDLEAKRKALLSRVS